MWIFLIRVGSSIKVPKEFDEINRDSKFSGHFYLLIFRRNSHLKRFVSTHADRLEKKKKKTRFLLIIFQGICTLMAFSLAVFLFLISSSNHGGNEITDYRLMNLFL